MIIYDTTACSSASFIGIIVTVAHID